MKAISITIGGHTIGPVASPGPCSFCGRPATGYTLVTTELNDWELCDSEDCWVNAQAKADELKAGSR